MPYRRLPNTDNARLNALKAALKKGKDLPPFKLSFAQGSFQRLQSLLPSYETALSEHKNSYNLQIEKNKILNRKIKKVRVYISHFIQVINMAICRGELPESTRKYFGLENYDKKLPSLVSEDEVFEWGKKLIDGEYKRRMEGLNPITNPTIAVVTVNYEQFTEAYTNQKNLRKRNSLAQDQLNRKRDEADQLIQQIWNEVEETYKDLPEEMRRVKASEYGLVYVFRKNELNSINMLDLARVNFG
jgi:hypothetical protein